jgi:hypothetical protein
VALGVMKAIKQALDPHNLMNPGKVIASWLLIDLAIKKAPDISGAFLFISLLLFYLIESLLI